MLNFSFLKLHAGLGFYFNCAFSQFNTDLQFSTSVSVAFQPLLSTGIELLMNGILPILSYSSPIPSLSLEFTLGKLSSSSISSVSKWLFHANTFSKGLVSEFNLNFSIPSAIWFILSFVCKLTLTIASIDPTIFVRILS